MQYSLRRLFLVVTLVAISAASIRASAVWGVIALVESLCTIASFWLGTWLSRSLIQGNGTRNQSGCLVAVGMLIIMFGFVQAMVAGAALTMAAIAAIEGSSAIVGF